MTIAETPATVDLWGKHTTDLQTGISLGTDAITGTLKHVADYSSAFPTGEDSGNYITVQVDSDTATTITAQVVGGTHGPVTIWDASDPDADGILVARITSTTQKLKFVATNNFGTKTYEYALTGLTLQSE